MDDEYISHSRTAQEAALDDEANAYETAMNAFIESLYTKLEESTAGLYMSYDEMSTETKSFVDGVTESVVLNAGNVKEVYLATGEIIDDCLMTPWTNAADAIGEFSSSEGALGLMNSWTESTAGAPFYDFQTKASDYLSKPWSTIVGAGGPVQTFKTSVGSVMSQIVSDVESDVSGISGFVSDLQTEIDKIKDTEIRITTVYEKQDDIRKEDNLSETPETQDENYETTATLKLGNKTLLATGSGSTKAKANSAARAAILGEYEQYKGNSLASESAWQRTWRNKVIYSVTKYAKGTTGTPRDQWAITDESWIGEEITLAAGKTGHLRGMMKGSAVLPSNISENLVEWGKLSPDEMNLGGVVNNYVNAPTNDVDVANSLTIDGKRSNTQGVHDSIKETYELIEDTVKNIDSVSQHYKPFVDEALTTPWVDAAEKTDEFNATVNANYDDIVNHIDENKESLEVALSTPYSNVTDDINDFSQHAQKASVDDIVTHTNEQSQALTTALSTGFNNASNATDAFKASGTSAVNAVKDSFTNEKTGLIKALNDTTAAAIKTKQAIDSVPTYSGSSADSGASVQAGEHYISSLGKNVTLSSNVAKWSSVAAQALQKTGQYSYDNLLLLLHQMQTESSGNQNAINNWDINAKNGTPSKGLMQVIDPTFQAYAMKGYDKDIYDPLSNIMAAIRYTSSRYGSLSKGWRGSGYAKGTTGTSKDEWALTDEPQFGDELVLVPGKDGNLSFMRKGTGVVSADLTQKLFELAQIPTSDLMNKNLTAIVPNITKNDFKNEFNFESLVHVDTVDSDTLPKLEKMVDKKIDDFSKALNYSLKRFAR